MTQCPSKLVEKPCALTGVGYLVAPYRPGATTMQLQPAHGSNFPALTGDQYFYINVESCDGCCGPIKVTARDKDVLTVVPNVACSCIASNAKVVYDNTSAKYISALALNDVTFAAPLSFNCDTRTLHVNCEPSTPDCGCGESTGTGSTGRKANPANRVLLERKATMVTKATEAYRGFKGCRVSRATRATPVTKAT